MILRPFKTLKSEIDPESGFRWSFEADEWDCFTPQQRNMLRYMVGKFSAEMEWVIQYEINRALGNLERKRWWKFWR